MDLAGRVIRSYGPLSETEHLQATIASHAHERASFCMVTRGSVGEGRATFGPDEVIFRLPAEEHANTFGPGGARCFNVLIEPALLPRLPVVRRMRPAIPFLRRLRRELRAQPSILVVEGLILQMLGEIFRVPAEARSITDRAMDIIQSRFTDPLTVRSLAEEIGTHPVHLSRCFTRERGQTIAETIRGIRVRYAMDLLRDPRLSIAGIAAASGFADQSHFTRVFGKATGATPYRWRLTRSR
jgi:AraC family transcriptional regulator